MRGTRPPLPQRYPCDTTGADWSAAIALLDGLLAALRAWQPAGLPPTPPTERDIVALATLGGAVPDLELDACESAGGDRHREGHPFERCAGKPGG
ncbi:hypothetical protein [Nocardia nova]|uniref:hypothetical protein n=1 Tax=Nocardia nova TaxID=37330 RepID=UPI0033C9E51B